MAKLSNFDFIGLRLAVAILGCWIQLQGQTLIDLRSQSRNVDFSNAASTKPSKTGTTLPVTCATGETFFKTDAEPGKNLYGCLSANTWRVLALDYNAGSGILLVGATVETDDAVTPVYYSGSGQPTIPCTAGRDYFVDTTGLNLYFCPATNSWSALAKGTHTHSAADIGAGVVGLNRGGTNQATWISGRCIQVSADGTKLESAGAACGTGGGGGGGGKTMLLGPQFLSVPSGTRYVPMGMHVTGTSTNENERRLILPGSGTMTALYVEKQVTQPADGALACTVRVNAVDTALEITVPAGHSGTQTFSGTASAPFSAGDRVSVRCVNSSASTSAVIGSMSILVDLQ